MAMGRFVILEHHWNGVHWDLMLERDGVLRTWAVDEAIVPGRNLPARALADHRLHYLEYEGVISGGRGSVRRCASGSYQSTLWTPDRVQFRLDGDDQVEGEAVLFRIESGFAPEPFSWFFRLGNLD
ncbi:DNA polymerase Ligase (LigD) [Singulisphaera sp. GP187]|uniref:DNA polymerase ligase N-terminal domain-containing protein n=1 Tax=Singulisphaera sp. GP187 TaxID=1882752 RepID=UPI000928089E|nr:DNA polymerase ligase N-terminal domain-containing protein [Singulisphaera sp. GP187]SIO01474.1 DNA polymerase Ligase (LigD) [Singulisphaera sp. GP187]